MTTPPTPERRCPCPTCSRQPPADAPSPGAQEPLPLSVNEALEVLRIIAIRKLEFRAIKALKEHIEAKACDLEELTDEHKKLQSEFDDMLMTFNAKLFNAERKLREAEAEQIILRDRLALRERRKGRDDAENAADSAALAGAREECAKAAETCWVMFHEDVPFDYAEAQISRTRRSIAAAIRAIPSPTSEKAEGLPYPRGCEGEGA